MSEARIAGNAGRVAQRSRIRSPGRLCSAARVLLVGALSVGGCGDSVEKRSDEEQLIHSTVVRQAGRSDILVVGGETITYRDIVDSPIEQDGALVSLGESLKDGARANTLDAFKAQVRPIIEQRVASEMSSILLYQEARRQIKDDLDEALTRAAERELRRFIMQHGGDEARAEAELKKMGLSRESYLRRQRKSLLTQYFISTRLPDDRPITHSELLKAYDEMKDKAFFAPDSLTFRLIDIRQTELPAGSGDPMARARELAGQLYERIKGGEDFGELAKQYSHGHRKAFGGLWKPVNPESLARPYDILAAQAAEMRPGQVASPIEAEGHVFILKLEGRVVRGYAPLEDVQAEVERKIIMDRRKEALEQINAKVQRMVDVGSADNFVNVCIEEIYRTHTQ